MYISETTKPAQRTGNDIKAMEYPTLKVPYELLNKRYRISQKAIDREVSHLDKSIQELKNTTDRKGVHRALDNVVEKLKVLKRKADESMLDEQDAAQVCKKRIDHLKEMSELPQNEVALNVWRKKRLDRLLVDHLLRDGRYETACRLTQHSGLEDLTNLELFMVSRRVEESLLAGDTSKCLAWCHDNKSKLRKLKSTLEFKLRQQEFIELYKQNKGSEAIQHSRKYLSNVEGPQQQEFLNMMGLLCQPLDTQREPYRSLLDRSRWLSLVEHFKRDNYNLFQLNSVSVFSVVLQAGLSALKTRHCYKNSGQKNRDCPICSPPLNELAKNLPYPHCSQSKLICTISGQPLNEHNPPMMLPNGYTYGEKSLQLMMDRDGMITCPKTKKNYHIDDALKVFLL